MKTHKKIKIQDTIYTANVEFRNVIECNRIVTDPKIHQFEKPLAVICTIFGPEGLDNPEHYDKLLGWVYNYLDCGKETDIEQEVDMDYIEDMDYIVASFQSDYGINLDEEEMDWKRFYNLLNGLSNSEFGNCCILNRIRNLRTFDLSQISDQKEREKIRKAKESVALKKNIIKNNPTKEQEKSMNEFNMLAGL